jgi:hypothetical protein
LFGRKNKYNFTLLIDHVYNNNHYTTINSTHLVPFTPSDGFVGSKLMAPEEDYNNNRMASFLFFTGPPSVDFLHSILYDPSPKYDEHQTLREKKNRFSNRVLAFSKGEVVIDNWRPIV